MYLPFHKSFNRLTALILLLWLKIVFWGQLYYMHKLSFCTAFTHSGCNSQEFDKLGSSRFKSSTLSQRHSRGGIYCMPFFYWKLGQKVRTKSVAQGNTDFSDATRVSSQRCRESILPWFLAKVGSGVRLNIARRCGAKRWAGFLPALTCASAGPQGWGIATS